MTFIKHGADSMASSTVQFFKIKAELPTILPTLATQQLTVVQRVRASTCVTRTSAARTRLGRGYTLIRDSLLLIVETSLLGGLSPRGLENTHLTHVGSSGLSGIASLCRGG